MDDEEVSGKRSGMYEKPILTQTLSVSAVEQRKIEAQLKADERNAAKNAKIKEKIEKKPLFRPRARQHGFIVPSAPITPKRPKVILMHSPEEQQILKNQAVVEEMKRKERKEAEDRERVSI